MKFIATSFFLLTIISCKPKTADKATVDAFEKYIMTTVEPFTSETYKLYNDSKDIIGKIEYGRSEMSELDSIKLFRQYKRCDSLATITIDRLSAINEPEEISNFDNGQLKRLAKEYTLETRKDITGPFLKLLKLYSSKRTDNFDSLKTIYVEEHEKQRELIRGLTKSILKLPYYQND